MQRYAVSSIEAARGLAVIAALALAAPAAATSGSSVQPGWLWPVLLAGVVVGLAVVALRGAASQERAVVGEGESTHSRTPVFVVTRDTSSARREASARSELRSAPLAAAPDVVSPAAVMKVLSSRMDEVKYEAGAPNVLSMTKHVAAGEGAGAIPSVALPSSLRVERSPDGQGTLVSIAGALDALTADELVPALEALVAERPPSLTLDLSSLSFLDATGAAAIVRLATRAGELGAKLRVTGLVRQPRAVFKLLRLDRSLVVA